MKLGKKEEGERGKEGERGRERLEEREKEKKCDFFLLKS